MAIDLTVCSQHGEATAIGWRQALVSRAETPGETGAAATRRSCPGSAGGVNEYHGTAGWHGMRLAHRAFARLAQPCRADLRRVAPRQLGHHAGADSARGTKVSAMAASDARFPAARG